MVLDFDTLKSYDEERYRYNDACWSYGVCAYALEHNTYCLPAEYEVDFGNGIKVDVAKWWTRVTKKRNQVTKDIDDLLNIVEASELPYPWKTETSSSKQKPR
jgi:hypothetical protein